MSGDNLEGGKQIKVRNVIRGGAVVAASAALVSVGGGMGLTASHSSHPAAAISSNQSVSNSSANVSQLSSRAAHAATPSTSPTGFTGWSGTPLSGRQLVTGPSTTSSATASPAWANGNGCGGYYMGTNPYDMHCRDTSTTVHGFRVAIRQGFWNGSNGFGWSKAYYYHNLYMQPIIDTIRMAANPTGSYSSRNYEIYHYYNGTLDQEVVVVADIVDTYFQGTYTQDGHSVGVITGFCNNGSGGKEPACPDWVDSSL